MAKFRAKLIKVRNSVVVFIPKPIQDSLNLQPGDKVEMIDIDDAIIIRKIEKRTTYKL
ncbi:MAG: AbrB/MazE/SpoVT family DNA-binding domain-containing protein [Nitrososphaerota archaeon]